MGLSDIIRGIGGKLRVIEIVPANETKPQRIKTRTVSLQELAVEIQSKQVQALAEQPAELSLDLDKVIEAAGVKAAAHGWTFCKLRELLATPQYRAMDREGVQQALAGLLAAQKAPVEDLVRDAIGRDQALDAFEEFARKKMKNRDEIRAAKVAELEAQIKELQDRCRQLSDEKLQDQQAWRSWHKRKCDYEKDLTITMGYLLDKPIITEDHELE